MTNVELLINFLITIFSTGGVGLLVLRMVDKRLDAQNKAQAIQLQIALKDKEADIVTQQAGQANLQSLVQLLQTQLQQIPLLTTHIRELVDRIDNNQRVSSANIDNILTAYRRDIDLVTAGFRTIADTNILQNSTLTRAIGVVEQSMGSIREMVADVQSGFVAQRADDERGQANLDEVVEMVVEMRNTVMRLSGHSESVMIRPPTNRQLIQPKAEGAEAVNTPDTKSVDGSDKPAPRTTSVEALLDSTPIVPSEAQPQTETTNNQP